MIDIEGVSVHYEGRRALADVTLHVKEGELFGILGPNGAGKTTLFSVLSGQRKATRGRARVAGLDTGEETRRVQALLGIVPQTFSGYEILTGMENLYFFGAMYRMRRRDIAKRARELLGMVSLQARAHDAVSTYSGGMRHRLNIILGLIHEPKVVILDEPTTGLDPIAREELWAIIRTLRAKGTTILLTTHYMQEAEALCDRVAILDRGAVKLMGAPRALGANLETAFRSCVTTDAVTDRAGEPVATREPAARPRARTRLKQEPQTEGDD